MKLSIIITGILVITVALLITISFILSTSIKTAYISSLDGDVQIQQGSKWYDAKLGQNLKTQNTIKTGNGHTTVILHESIIINLAPQTEIVIDNLEKENIELTQISGTTWNKFLKLNDVTELTINSKNLIGTTEETEFGNSQENIFVAKGKIEVFANEQWYELLSKQKLTDKNGEITVEKIVEGVFKQETKTMLNHMIELRNAEIEKNNKIFSNKQQIYDMMLSIEKGESTTEQSIKKTDSIKRAIALSQKIREQRLFIEELEE